MFIKVKVNKNFAYLFLKGVVALLIGALNIMANIETAEATFSLSVRPYEGTLDLRFGKSEQALHSQQKEVTVTVTTDIGKRYQVIQTLLQPITNAEGAILPREAFTVYTLRGSNTTGTLDLDSPEQVTPGRTLVYTSNTGGVSDSFTVVYALRRSLIKNSGFYQGRLNFFLEPIDSTQTPVTVELDVEIDVQVPTEVEVTTLTGSKTIELELPKKGGLPAEVTVSIKGASRQYRILQMVGPVMNSEGEELRDGLTFSVRGGSNGVIAQTGEVGLRQGQTLLYTSSLRGMNDEIIITYDIKEGLKSSTYRGKISYYIEGPLAYPRAGYIDTLELRVDIESIFKIKATPPAGGIQFRNVKPGRLQENEVLIAVESNMNKPYQVSQRMSGLLTNEQGQTIPDQAFTLRTVPEDKEPVQGTLKHPQKRAVKVGETVLFISNSAGTAESFKIIYELKVNQQMNVKVGDYSAQIVYSMSAL